MRAGRRIAGRERWTPTEADLGAVSVRLQSLFYDGLPGLRRAAQIGGIEGRLSTRRLNHHGGRRGGGGRIVLLAAEYAVCRGG